MPRARKDYHVATSVFPLVRLEKILSPVQRAEDVDPDKTYHLLGAHWYALGLYTKEIKPGSEIRASKLYLVREGDFVYNRLFAWKGAFAVANAENNGCYVSSEFPCFAIDEERADAQYIAYYFRRAGVWNEALGLSSGSTPTSRNRLKEAQLLAMRIPLPPLDEQRRIVARIEAVAAKVSEARGLREGAVEETQALLAAETHTVFNALADAAPCKALRTTFTFRNDLIRPSDGVVGSLRFVGLQHVESHTGKKLGQDWLLAEQLQGRKFRFSPGEIVYGYLRPYLNKVWVADSEGICSVDQYVLKPLPQVVDTLYLAYFMRSPVFLERAIELTHNLILPRLRTALLESILIPLPSLAEQRRIVAYLDALQAKVEALKALQAETSAELDSLLPSVLDKAFEGEL